MATGENEAETIVLERLIVQRDRVNRRFESSRQFCDRCIEPGAPAQDIDRLEPSSGDEPRERITGQPVARPTLDRGRECFVQRLLSQVEVADEANECGQNTARVRAVIRLDGVADRNVAQLNTSIGLTSTQPVRADGIFAATCSASFRSRASIR